MLETRVSCLCILPPDHAEQPYQEAFVGRAGVRDYWARVTAGQANIDMRYGAPITVGHRTAVEWWTTLTNGGTPITLAGAFILTFDSAGLCRTLREYWQFVEGTKAPAPGWGSTSCRTPSAPKAGKFGWRAKWGKARPLCSRCRWPRRSRSGNL